MSGRPPQGVGASIVDWLGSGRDFGLAGGILRAPAMTIDDLTGLLAPVAPIVVATAWIHVSLSKIGTKLEVAISQLTDHRERILRLEEKVERLELANARSGKENK